MKNIMEALRVCSLIIFNVGMGGVASTVFSINNQYAGFGWIILASVVGNFLIVEITEVPNEGNRI